MSAAAFANARLARSLGLRRLGHGAPLAFTVVSGLHLALALAGASPFPVFFLLQATAMCLFGFIGANFNAMAMEPMGRLAGTAAAVVGFLQTLVGAALGTLIGLACDGSVVPLAAGHAVLGLTAIGIALVAERGGLMAPRNVP